MTNPRKNTASLDLIRARTVIDSNGCWIWQGSVNKDGYGKISVDCRDWRAHRLAWVASGHSLDANELVCHRCDNPRCCNPDHLFLGTQRDNVKDRTEKGRSASGDRNGARIHPEKIARGEHQGLSRLTVDHVLAIRKHFDEGITRDDLAAAFSVSKATIQQVVSRKTWRHV